MPIVVNTNAAATTAAFNLSKNNEALRKSLARLSSGNRITQPAEDAGGLAVAYKLDSHVRRTEAVLNNHQNALSYLQVQDGVLETMGSIVNRMSELRTMAADVTKNTSDVENYSKEFRELQSQLNQLQLEKFNGVSLFTTNANIADGSAPFSSIANQSYTFVGPDGTKQTIEYEKKALTLLTHPSGQSKDGSISLNGVNVQFMLQFDHSVIPSLSATNTGNLGGFTADNANSSTNLTTLSISNNIFTDISQISIYQFTHIIEKIADARAENGAEQQRVTQSYQLYQTNMVNLEAAHGRIMDADVALESTRFARNNVLVQASASMTAQANQLTNIALTLLQ